MTPFLILALLIQLLVMILWGLRKPDRSFQLPFLTSVGFAGYLLPQFISLSFRGDLPIHALDETLLMTIFSLAACHIGYVSNLKSSVIFDKWKLSRKRLIYSSAILTFFGAYFFYKVSTLAAEVSLEHGGQWTGIITIYAFFSQMLTIGFVIAVILHLKQSSPATLLICVFGIGIYLERIVLHGRRSSMIELFLILTLSFWFVKRVTAPRWLIVLVIGAGVLIVNSIGDYRSTMLEGDRTTWTGAGFNQIFEIDYAGNLKKSFQEGGWDVLNAVYIIDYLSKDVNIDYGLSIYNSWIIRYIPAQIVGSDTKKRLLLDFIPNYQEILGGDFNTGTTLTGISEAFGWYWYLGSASFYFVGVIASRWYRASIEQKIHAQIIFLLIAYPALLVFPFSVSQFFFKFFELMIFLFPVLLFSRIKK